MLSLGSERLDIAVRPRAFFRTLTRAPLVYLARRSGRAYHENLRGSCGGVRLVESDDAEDAAGESVIEALTRYRRQLARKIARLVKPYDVEDIVQETCLRVFQAAQRQPIRSPRAFMLKTARNLAINNLRWADALNHMVADDGADNAECAPAGLEDALEERTPESLVASEQEFVVFCRAIRALPRQRQRVILLRRVYGLSQREVATKLGISERTVENHIAQAVVACSDFMEAQGFPRQALRRAITQAQVRRRE
jgi:RNA polymerase sigma factor (sigma-70 family)